MSKGSTRRPTDQKQFDENYDKIFKKKPSEEDELEAIDEEVEDDSFWTEYAR